MQGAAGTIPKYLVSWLCQRGGEMPASQFSVFVHLLSKLTNGSSNLDLHCIDSPLVALRSFKTLSMEFVIML